MTNEEIADAMVRDFTQVQPRSKSEVRQRLQEYGQWVREQRDKELVEMIEEWKPIQWSEQSLSEMKDDIINLISNSKK